MEIFPWVSWASASLPTCANMNLYTCSLSFIFFLDFTFQFVSVVVPCFDSFRVYWSQLKLGGLGVFSGGWFVVLYFFITAWMLFQALSQKPGKTAEWPWLLGLAGTLSQLNPCTITGWNSSAVFRVVKKNQYGVWNNIFYHHTSCSRGLFCMLLPACKLSCGPVWSWTFCREGSQVVSGFTLC